MTSPLVSLNDDREIPQFGLGVWQASPADATVAIREALLAGYRHIDTAAAYKNEDAVAAGLRESGIERSEVFITTKVWNDAQGAVASRDAAHASLELLGTDYIDLLLIHWPAPSQDLYLETWQTLIELRNEGLVRSIGVSNFTAAHLDRIIADTGVTPVLNQIELHPYLQQAELSAVHADRGIATEAWSPLAQNKALNDPAIAAIAAKYGKTPAQVIIRWHLDQGRVVIPKSVTPERIRSNADVFDFSLQAADLAAIDALNKNERLGPDPATFG